MLKMRKYYLLKIINKFIHLRFIISSLFTLLLSPTIISIYANLDIQEYLNVSPF